MTNTYTLDFSNTVYFQAVLNSVDFGERVKDLSGNKARVEMNDEQMNNLYDFACGLEEEGTANERRAASGTIRAIEKLDIDPAAYDDPVVEEPAPAPKEEEKKPAAKKKPKITQRAQAEKKAATKRAKAERATVSAEEVSTTTQSLYKAFDMLNDALFDGKLPPVMLVTHRKRGAHGYFWSDQWVNGTDKKAKLSEIALNPETMSRAPKVVLSTLAHEMVHHEQFTFGKPSKSGHNVQWCEWMERIGLKPYGVGTCKGKRSGRHFTHDVVEGGAFDKIADEILARDDIDLSWFAKPQPSARKQDTSKVMRQCTCCGNKAWGKEDMRLFCGDHDEPQEMVMKMYLK